LQIGAPASLGYFGVETYANSGTPSDQAAYGILIEGFVRCEIGHASGIHVPDGVVQLTGGTGDAVTAWLGTPTNGGTGKALSLYASGPVEIAGSVLLSGSMTTAIRSIATTGGTTDALDSDHVLDFTGTSVHTYNLPACSAGRELDIHNSSTGQVTLNLNGSDTQNGVAVDIILTANQGVRLVGNGTNWTVR
jgi:hypothetical protein